MKTIFLLLAWWGVTAAGIAHPFYVSITQIDYKNNALQITLKVFAADLEQALEENEGQKIRLEDNSTATTQALQNYINRHLELTVNGTKGTIKYVGKELESDAVWIYLEMPAPTAISQLLVKNTMLFQQFDTQTNLIHTNINGEKKSLILTKDVPKDQLEF